MDARRKTTSREPTRFEEEDRKRIEDALENRDDDVTNPEALKEAARLGTTDVFLVKTDLGDKDQREDGDQPDGRASPMANADNQER